MPQFGIPTPRLFGIRGSGDVDATDFLKPTDSALRLAQHSGRETVQNPATRCTTKDTSSEDQSATDSSQFPRENVVLPTVFGGEIESSGGGIRTPDTRIMIPLL